MRSRGRKNGVILQETKQGYLLYSVFKLIRTPEGKNTAPTSNLPHFEESELETEEAKEASHGLLGGFLEQSHYPEIFFKQ